MTCTELAYFQTAPKDNPIRSKKVDLDWHRESCNTIFGKSLMDTIWPPKVEDTNNIYGGVDFSGFNVFFTNGVEDPWQWAGIRENPADPRKDWQYDAIVVNCTQCAHCVDLYSPTASDAPELVHTRNLFEERLSSWFTNPSEVRIE